MKIQISDIDMNRILTAAVREIKAGKEKAGEPATERISTSEYYQKKEETQEKNS